jgi:hypothetical protein
VYEYIQGWFPEQFSGSRRLSEQLLESQAAIGQPEQSFCRGFSQFDSDFIEESRNFNLDILHKKTTKKIVKPSALI